MAEAKDNVVMEKIVSLCKRRGFVFQSSEIYGGINGFWDYGPLGAELKRNVKELWWTTMTRLREDVAGLEATIIMHPQIWKASGHVDTFSDPMCDCLLTKKRFRADQIEPQSGLAYHLHRGPRHGVRPRNGRALRGPPPAREAPRKRPKTATTFYLLRGLPNVELLGERTEKGRELPALQPRQRRAPHRAPPVQPDVQNLRRAGRRRG
jgi:glycyl-tRNA synthetase